jgi:dihydropteroate synthase
MDAKENADSWQCREHALDFIQRPLVMGVINVTPDSFSDGGQYDDPVRAVDHALALLDQGADLLDIGGESTRPGALEVSEEQEIHRVLPVVRELVRQTSIPISVDTRKVAVARVVLDAGAAIINDVEASRQDDAMWQLVAQTGAGYVAMHMQGQPRTMQHAPNYSEVVSEVYAFFTERLDAMHRSGIKKQQVVLDVGIGFGKDLSHNLELLRSIECFGKLERPIMLGVSRKSLFKALLGVEEPSRRLPAGLATALWAVNQGVKIIRTHDVAETVQALAMWEALQGKNQL